MSAFTVHSGVCAPILQDNVDTDQIIPSREMKRVSKEGLGEGLFAAWRYEYESGEKTALRTDFVLNQAAYDNTSILLGGRNFGCGSSREHAVWALRDFGIRAIIAESYGRIFGNNCARNKILALRLSAAEIEEIRAATAPDPQALRITVDLQQSRVELPNQRRIAFEIDAFDRDMLLKGLDYIEVTLQYAGDIENFQTRDRLGRSWAYL